MDTQVIDRILKDNNAFRLNANDRRDAQELSSMTNESLESDQEIYSVSATKINTLSSSIDFSIHSSQNQTNRIENIQFELDESMINENVDNILTNSQVSSKSKQRCQRGDFKKDKTTNNTIEENQREQYDKNQHSNQTNIVKNIHTEEDIVYAEYQQNDGKETYQGVLDSQIENLQLKKQLENMNLNLKQQEKENFYLHQNIKSLKEELYQSKLNTQKILQNNDILKQNSILGNQTKSQIKFLQDDNQAQLNIEDKQNNQKQTEDQNQICALNDQVNLLRNEMSTMKDMYLAKLKEQSFIVDTLTTKLGEKDEFIQKMKTSYINSLNQSKNSQIISQSQVSGVNNSNSFSLQPHFIQESIISDLSKGSCIQQNIQQQQISQQPFNNTFDQVKLSQEFEQLRRDIKFSTIGNISPFLRDEKVREDLLSTTSNLQQCANNSSSNSNYCNQSTNNYSKTYLQQQSPFNQSKYHNLSHISNLSNRGLSGDFNPNTSMNGGMMQSTQQNQGSGSNITIMNQTGINCNNSVTTHLTSTSANSSSNNNNSRCRSDHTQKRNSSFTASSANVSHNLNQSIALPPQNGNSGANTSILQFTPVSHKHSNQKNQLQLSAQNNNSQNQITNNQQQNQTSLIQSNQTQMQQIQKQQQITLDFRLTFNQNEMFSATQAQQQQFSIISQQENNSQYQHSNSYNQEISQQQPQNFSNKNQAKNQQSSHSKQNSLPPQLINNLQIKKESQYQNNSQHLILENDSKQNESKQTCKNHQNNSQKYNPKEINQQSQNKYIKNVNDPQEKQKDITNLNYNNHITQVQQNNSMTNKCLKEQLMHQQILQQKKQQILQSQQQQTYQNLIVKNNNQDLLKNLKRQAASGQNQSNDNSNNNGQSYSGISPKKQQSRSYHIPSTQPQQSTNKTQTQQQSYQQQQPNQQKCGYLQEITKDNNNQIIGQSSTKSSKPLNANQVINSNQLINMNQGISTMSNLQENTIPGSTTSINSSNQNNIPIFLSMNEQQNHNTSCNHATNNNNPNNCSFKFLNKSNNSQNCATSQQSQQQGSNKIQPQVEKKRFLQTTQISTSTTNSGNSNKLGSIASPSKHSNNNNDQKQLFLRTQQIYSSNNNTQQQYHQSSSTRQKSLAIPQNCNQNQASSSSQKVPMSAGSTRKNNSLLITNAANNNYNINSLVGGSSTVNSTSSSQSGGIQEIFKFNQGEKQKKINDFFSKTLQVKPGELKSLNENLGCYSHSKNAAKLIQQMEFSSFDDVDFQLDDLQILSNQIKEVLQNDPLKKSSDERSYKNSMISNNPLRSSGGGGIGNLTSGASSTNHRSQSENHNYQNLKQQLQLHQQLTNYFGGQSNTAQCSSNSKKAPIKSFENTQQLQNYIDDAQMQIGQINSNSQSCTNQKVRPPKNNNFIFNENNKVISYGVNPSLNQRNSSVNSTSNNQQLKNNNYKNHRKHLTLLNPDDINSKNQGNYAQSEISTQKASFNDIHNNKIY